MSKTETTSAAAEKVYILRNRDVRGQNVLSASNETIFLPPKGKKKIRKEEISGDMKRLVELNILALDDA